MQAEELIPATPAIINHRTMSAEDDRATAATRAIVATATYAVARAATVVLPTATAAQAMAAAAT
jgi:hypothetical protein